MTAVYGYHKLYTRRKSALISQSKKGSVDETTSVLGRHVLGALILLVFLLTFIDSLLLNHTKRLLGRLELLLLRRRRRRR